MYFPPAKTSCKWEYNTDLIHLCYQGKSLFKDIHALQKAVHIKAQAIHKSHSVTEELL